MIKNYLLRIIVTGFISAVLVMTGAERVAKKSPFLSQRCFFPPDPEPPPTPCDKNEPPTTRMCCTGAGKDHECCDKERAAANWGGADKPTQVDFTPDTLKKELRGTSEAQPMHYSADSWAKTIDQRRSASDGVFQYLKPNWISNQFPKAKAVDIAERVRERFRVLVESRIPEPQLLGLEIRYADLNYPTDVRRPLGSPSVVKVQRLRLHVTDATADERYLVIYFLNYDKAQPPYKFEDSDVLFAINGHYSYSPSLQELGICMASNETGIALAQFAWDLKVPIVTFDDRNMGESGSTGHNLGLVRELADIWAVEKAMLLSSSEDPTILKIYKLSDEERLHKEVVHNWHSVHVVGISGGGQRAAYYLMSHKSTKLKSVYIAAPGQAYWMALDTNTCSGNPIKSPDNTLTHDNRMFGVNEDTHDFVALSNFEYSDFFIAGITEGISVAFATNRREGGMVKNWFWCESAKTLLLHGVRVEVPTAHGQPINNNACANYVIKNNISSRWFIEVRGEDPLGNGDSSKGLFHSYDILDYEQFFRSHSK